MIALFALMLALAGFAALAVAMHKHHRVLCGAPPSRARAIVLRVAGWVLLGLSLHACVVRSGWGIGPVLWFGLLTLSGLAVALSLAYRQAARRKIGRASCRERVGQCG